ncbi:MAG: SUMF1/EgtB/PvdO family nonheme iron enzyme [Nitrospinae bacterium]|nr:SUMF1/EgtB/PvdO family nonheme iron enzyme [Nitrospinota bacterium]
MKIASLVIVLSIFVSVNIANAADDDMALVSGGKFSFGEDKKKIELGDFYIDKYEVTNAQYKKFRPEHEIPDGKENHPVADISYFDAEDYCKSAGKRIPTSEEWEKAARGTDGRAYPWGDKFDSKKANTSEGGKGGTVKVGSYEGGKSPYGAYDMSGNVWEWVDAWDSKKQYRVARGGSYFEGDDMNRTTSSLMSIPDDIHEYIGFRCAKSK